MQQDNAASTDDKQPSIAKMLSFAPTATPPIFTGNWDHRPNVPSPLSSSPLRANSPQSSPVKPSAFSPRAIQSSPIPQPKFRYASRPARANPLLRRREDKQADQRRNFLQNVRDKSADKAWQRRDIEGNSTKTSWLANLDRLTYDAPTTTEDDIEEAMAFQEAHQQPAEDEADDDMITDEYSAFEDSILASFEAPEEPSSPGFEDDFDDSIFDDLIAQEASMHDMEMDMN